MNKNHTDITILLDRSSSMEEVRHETIQGFNTFLDGQRTAPGTATLTLHQFNTNFQTVMRWIDVKQARNLTFQTFVPSGYTALLDAMGRAITEAGKRFAKMEEAERPGRVVFVIMTDGEENSSHLYTHEQVMKMIAHQREKYAWEFVFLGADQDAIKVGTGYAIAAGNSLRFVKSGEGVRRAYVATTQNLVQMRSGLKADMSYTVEQRKDQDDAGA